MLDGRPEVLVDLDGVVYDWVGTMSGYLQYQGIEAPMELYSQWSVWEDWGISKGEFLRLWRMGVEDKVIYAQGALIEGAREALWYLSDQEYHIHFITNRLTKFGLHKEIVENTVSWLREAAVPYRSLSFTHNKGVKAEFGIDDSPDNIEQMQDAGVGAYLFTAPHNLGESSLPRVDSWAEFIDQVEGMNHG